MKITKLKYCIVYDEVLTLEQEKEIQDIITDERFIWTDFCDHTVGPELQEQFGDSHTKEMSQYVSIQVADNHGTSLFCNKFGNLLKIFLEKNKFTAEYVFRIKVNLQEKSTTHTEHDYATPHLDYYLNHNVLLYYPYDSDGDTLFFNKTGDSWDIVDRVTPKQGRFVLFAGDQYHSGQPPLISEKRVVVNFDFK
jgi:hypothetical protein